MDKTKTIFITILVIVLVVFLYFVTRPPPVAVNTPPSTSNMGGSQKTTNSKFPPKIELPPYSGEESYITPKEYKIGLMHPKEYKSANLCNDKVLYPIQQLSVDYGSTVPDDCPCTQFVKSP